MCPCGRAHSSLQKRPRLACRARDAACIANSKMSCLRPNSDVGQLSKLMQLRVLLSLKDLSSQSHRRRCLAPTGGGCVSGRARHLLASPRDSVSRSLKPHGKRCVRSRRTWSLIPMSSRVWSYRAVVCRSPRPRSSASTQAAHCPLQEGFPTRAFAGSHLARGALGGVAPHSEINQESAPA